MTQFRALVDYSDKMLVLQMNDGAGEISVPVKDRIVANLRLELPEMPAIYNLLRQELYTEALKKMRPIVYPLIKFHELPSGFLNLHRPLQTMMEALIKMEAYDEVEFI